MNKEPKLVDLGLPSGNLWLSCNMGTDSETDFGLYYQWGSLIGYKEEGAAKHSNWKTCPFNNGKETFDEEYFRENWKNYIYKNNNLKSEYDIVTQTYGPDFKIPARKDFRELLDNTTTKFVNKYKEIYVNGSLITSKINGNTLFLPYAGEFWKASHYDKNESYFFWLSEFITDFKRIFTHKHDIVLDTALYVSNNDSRGRETIGLINSCWRYHAFTIRGIKVTA